MTSWACRAARGFYILRYHRPSQLALRLVSIARRRYEAVRKGGRYGSLSEVELSGRAHAGLEWIANTRWKERGAEPARGGAARVLEGRFRFLNVERELPDPIDWRLECWPDAPHLWRFHLHYHEFLLDLVAEEGEAEKESRPLFSRAWEIVLQWIEHNRLDDPRVLRDAWHPFCISRRLPVWICLWIASPPASALQGRVLASMHAQARYLADHLERDLGGNHLLENLRALIVAACFLECPEAERWRNRAARLLQDELAAQILPHGEHFERSPMYHAAMLDAVLDIRDAAGNLMPETARLAAETAGRMGEFLRGILHPDGQIPLLGDSCFGETPSPERLLVRSAACGPLANRQRSAVKRKSRLSSGTLRQRPVWEAEPADRYPHPNHAGWQLNEEVRATGARWLGDYWIYRDEQSLVLFDAGPVGPDHLPAHAHADLLTFEASFRGSRLFVDSGVGSYDDDAVRRYCRSTAAHNLLEIDGVDQCDTWSSFRMGYRGRPSGLTAGETAEFRWARACHNAYRRLGVPAVGRWFACRPGGPWICVDWAAGQGEHRLTSRLHLHPSVTVAQGDGGEVLLQLGETAFSLRFLTPGEVSVAEGWYCPAMGCRRPAPMVCWTASTPLPAVCGWSLAWDGAGTGVLESGGTDSRRGRATVGSSLGDLRLRWTDGSGSVELWPIGVGSS